MVHKSVNLDELHIKFSPQTDWIIWLQFILV